MSDLSPSRPSSHSTVVVTSSVRQGRFARNVTSWVLDHLGIGDASELDDLDLATLDLNLDLSPSAGSLQLRSRLEVADAVVIVTPEYDHSIPAALKLALEHVRGELQARPVGIVSYGGLSGGLRASEHLRAVLAVKHAVVLRDTVSLHGVWDLFDAGGAFRDGPAAAAAGVALERMTERLEWYAWALREGRRVRPYAA